MHFFLKKLTTFLVVALKTQAANAANCFSVKLKQINRWDMVTFLFSVHTITEAKTYAGRSQGGGSSSQVIWPHVLPGVAPPLFTIEHPIVKRFCMVGKHWLGPVTC